MFGNHVYAEAVRIAREKSEEYGEQCIVLEATDRHDRPLLSDSGEQLYTIGVPLRETTPAEFKRRLLGGG